MLLEGCVFGERGDATCTEENYLNHTLCYFNQFIPKEAVPQAKHYIFFKDGRIIGHHRVFLYVPSDLKYGAHFLDSDIGCTIVSLKTGDGIGALTEQRANEIEKGIKIPEKVLMKFKEYILKKDK